MKQDVAKYQCDTCKRIKYTDRSVIPTGWRQFSLWNEDDEPHYKEPKDMCGSCSEAVFTTLGRRKAIERGDPEKETMPVHLSEDQIARQTAMLIAARVPKPAADMLDN